MGVLPVSHGQVAGALLTVEGLHNIEVDFDNVETLYDAGVRMAGFAHFFDKVNASRLSW